MTTNRPTNRDEARAQWMTLRGLVRQNVASESQIVRFAELSAALEGRATAARESAEWEALGSTLRRSVTR